MMPQTTRQSATDEELARAVTGRDAASQQAFQALYQRYRWRLVGLLKSRGVKVGLDDVHQDVWLRVWQHLPDRFDGHNFRGWLFQIACNRAADLGRGNRPTEDTELSGLPDRRRAGPVETLIGRELEDEERAHVRQLEECLGEMERRNAASAALVRGRLAGQAYDALCARLQLTKQRAQRLFHTLKEQLRRCVGKGTV